ncbi:nucleoside triphosphate hydrolase [Thermus scotoductus]|uniref:Nucleoside triphosphate hydrolase n=1 Tax=Thermus scotoductus TaxID=37636 RepID=A0A430V3M6_THESC|nr:MazG family protein [Thermus scotoductus]RTI17575.1 nucleoside triphosphate hydrolase [Thermus scotoductus]
MGGMGRLLEVMRRLRGPGGCPWDRAQTHESLIPYLLEEASEAADALLKGDSQEMAEELGDVLLQVAFHSVIAEEEGRFSYEDVERSIVEKLIRRHPHVFGEGTAKTPEEVKARWEELKAEEGKKEEPCGLPKHLPTLLRAYELQRKGVDPGSAEGLRAALEKGDLEEALWNLVGLFAKRGLDPETALRRRFQRACQEG